MPPNTRSTRFSPGFNVLNSDAMGVIARQLNPRNVARLSLATRNHAPRLRAQASASARTAVERARAGFEGAAAKLAGAIIRLVASKRRQPHAHREFDRHVNISADMTARVVVWPSGGMQFYILFMVSRGDPNRGGNPVAEQALQIKQVHGRYMVYRFGGQLSTNISITRTRLAFLKALVTRALEIYQSDPLPVWG